MSACDNICKTKIEQQHVRFTKIYQLWPSSIALLEHSSLLLFSKNHFSKFFNFFQNVFGHLISSKSRYRNTKATYKIVYK